MYGHFLFPATSTGNLMTDIIKDQVLEHETIIILHPFT